LVSGTSFERRQIRRLRAECAALNASVSSLRTENERLVYLQKEQESTVAQFEKECRLACQERDAMSTELAHARSVTEEALSAKSLFVANMSHELRTPLNGIIGLARNLTESGLNSRLRSEVELIQMAGEDLIRMVNDILDLSKLDASKVELESIRFHLGELLEGAFGLLYPQAVRKGLCCFLSYQPEISRRYIGDPFRIRQMFLNLLSNALKFTDRGLVWVHAWVEPLRASGSLVHIRFEDTGVGVEQ
jgi:signal transduction histidine kinase